MILATSSCFAQSKPKQDTSVYYLNGIKVNFQLLLNAIRHPQDVTPRIDSAIVAWILTAEKPITDSTKVVKK